jgi:hypothetical protein
MDTGNKGREHNIYFALNNALRGRKADPGPFLQWRGFLYFLMRALDQLPAFSGTVCVVVVVVVAGKITYMYAGATTTVNYYMRSSVAVQKVTTQMLQSPARADKMRGQQQVMVRW